MEEKEGVINLVVDLIKNGFSESDIEMVFYRGIKNTKVLADVQQHENGDVSGILESIIKFIESSEMDINEVDAYFDVKEFTWGNKEKVSRVMNDAKEIIDQSKEDESPEYDRSSYFYIDHYDFDIDDDHEEKNEKSKKLMEKINLLCEKVEQEKNPLKRHILQFKIKMLVSKIQKEIDIQNIKDKYDRKRNQAEIERENSKDELYNEVVRTQNDIKALKDIIKGHEEYDYESKEFLFNPKLVKKEGGIQEFTEKLKQKEGKDVQRAAEKIERMNEAKEQLKNLKEQLKAQNDELISFDKNSNKDIKSLNKEEKALIKREKGNIFSRIGKFFGTLAEETKLYMQERQELKEMEKIHKEEMAELKAIQDEEYEKFLEKQAKEREELAQEQSAKIEMDQEYRAKDAAANFRDSKKVLEEEMLEGNATGDKDDAEEVKEFDDDELEF